MFDIHISNNLIAQSSELTTPLVVIGETGNGKTIFLLQLALELIKNNQCGILYDPYGDLARDIQKNLKSVQAKNNTVVVTQEEFLSVQQNSLDKFTVVSGNTIEDGAAATNLLAQAVLKQAYTMLGAEDWLIIDQASGMVDADLFSKYIATGAVPKTVLSDQTLINFSAKQRDELFSKTKQWVIYQVRNIDGQFIEENLNRPSAADIVAQEQYHFYWVNHGEVKYHAGPWPVQAI